MIARGRTFSIGFAALASLALAALVQPASAQDWQKEWNDTLARAKDQELNVAVHATDGHAQTVDVFRQRYPDIKVNLTVILPSAFVPRLLTEQKNGMFVWDSFWGGSSNIVNAVLPAGGLNRISDYFILPEVKDPSNWNAPDYLYASPEPLIFLHTNYQESGIFYNSDVVKDLKTDTYDFFLDPRLKGKIAVRDPSRPNVATGSLAGLIKNKGPDFARKILTEQNPLILENARQVDDALMRGEVAVLIGGSQDVFATCKKEGGCKSIDKLRFGSYVRSIAMVVPKNAPHTDTTKVWVNWLLSKDGQTTFVEQYGKYNDAGAISMRKDVPPHPKNVDRVPDYSRFNEYLRISVAEGESAQIQVTSMYADIKKNAK